MNPQDRKDLEKFTKFFIYKSIQTIVQSRLGERIKTKSKEFSTGTEWFNLAINDIHEVQVETKKALHGKPLIPVQPVCVEISLKTSDNEWMILETWCLEWDSDLADQAVKVSYTVYNRLSILLKSLTCVTRVVPAYRISRQQSADSYVMCYRVYVGEPQLTNLGDSFLTKKVGQVTSPLGTLSVTLAYRVRMLLSPGNKNIPLAVKEDHYNCRMEDANEDPLSRRKITSPQQCIRNNSVDNGTSEEDLCNAILFCTSPSSVAPDANERPNSKPTSAAQDDPVCNKASDSSELSSRISLATIDADDIDASSQGRTNFEATARKDNLFPNTVRLGAFAPPIPKPASDPTCPGQTDADGIIPDTPYPAMFHLSMDSQSNSNSKSDSNSKIDNLEESNSEDKVAEVSTPVRPEPVDQEFVLVELRPPFADGDAKCDVGAFYRDCQNAPQLACFEEDTNLETTVKQITDQLNYYDDAQHDLDKFIDSLAVSDDSEMSEPENLNI